MFNFFIFDSIKIAINSFLFVIKEYNSNFYYAHMLVVYENKNEKKI